jgi:hypothetical protein
VLCTSLEYCIGNSPSIDWKIWPTSTPNWLSARRGTARVATSARATGLSCAVKKMAPIKGPFAGLVPVVMMMVVVVPRLCAGDGWQCERNGRQSRQNITKLLHQFLPWVI